MQRRTAIKSIGGIAALSALGTSALGTTRASEGGLSKKEQKSLNKKVAKARVEGNDEKAGQLLEEYGAEGYNFETIVLDESNDSDEISTQHRYRKGQSTFELSMWDIADVEDHYMIQGVMNLSGYKNTNRAADRIADIIGFTFNKDHWSLGNVTRSFSPYMYKFGDGEKHHTVSLDGYDPNESGVTGSIDIMGGEMDPHNGRRDYYYEKDVSFALEASVQALDDKRPPIFFEYFHNYSYPFKGSIDKITIGAGSNGLGINVEFTRGGYTAWDEQGYAEYKS